MRAPVTSLHSSILLALLALSTAAAAAGEAVHHELRVGLEPAENAIRVRDRITIPAALAAGDGEPLRFVLHAGLELGPAPAGFEVEALDGPPRMQRYGINEEEPGESAVALREYLVRSSSREPSGAVELELSYADVTIEDVEPQSEVKY